MTHHNTQPDPQLLLEFALDAAWQAGRLTLGHFQTSVPTERKADNSPVTLADRQAEELLRELITRYWPEHGIVGEEFGRAPGNSPYTWIIDPIDGTKSFVSGVPLYSNLLALTDGEEALIGVANFPALGDMIYARRGGGCYWNGRRAHVSAKSTLTDALILTSEIEYYKPRGREGVWQELCARSYAQRTWGDAYGYFLVATGRAEVMLDPAMYVWDCGPFQVIMEEAGGTFTDWQGRRTIHAGESIATNGALLEEVLAVIRETEAGV